MLNSQFRDINLREDWVLFENDLLNHGFIKEPIGKILKYIWIKKLENVTISLSITPDYFKLLEIDIAYHFVIKIYYNKMLLIEDRNIYYILPTSFEELCKTCPILSSQI